MAHSDKKAQMREDAVREARLDEEKEARTANKLRRFQRATLIVGILLFVDVAFVSQFLHGHQWYEYREPIGGYLLELAGWLLSGFMLCVGLTYSLWSYLRSLRKIHRAYAPPLSTYRTGTRSNE